MNKSGSNGPKRGWSVSMYRDMQRAAVELSMGTRVQGRISRSSSRGSQSSDMAMTLSVSLPGAPSDMSSGICLEKGFVICPGCTPNSSGLYLVNTSVYPGPQPTKVDRE